MAHHIFIQGPLGSGKTFLMSLLAQYWRQKTIARGGNVELFANYDLKNATMMRDYEDWYAVAAAESSIVCFDEAHMAFSNRKWNNFGNTIATELLIYTRKMGAVLMYCSPSVQNVDSRIRNIVEILIDVRRTKTGFSVMFTDYQTNQYMHTQYIPMSLAKKIFKLNMYDTNQMVSHFPLPKTEAQSNIFFEKLEKIHDKKRGKEYAVR